MKRAGKKGVRAVGIDLDRKFKEADSRVIDGMNTLALEDLVTFVLESFTENARELGWHKLNTTIADWYMGLSDKEKYRVSDKLLQIMDAVVKKGGKGA